MENQHEITTGYRDLTQEEINLMNRIKAKGAELLALHAEVAETIVQRKEHLLRLVEQPSGTYLGYVVSDAQNELELIEEAEPYRWAAIAKTDIQTGIMALVRAVTKPTV